MRPAAIQRRPNPRGHFTVPVARGGCAAGCKAVQGGAFPPAHSACSRVRQRRRFRPSRPSRPGAGLSARGHGGRPERTSSAHCKNSLSVASASRPAYLFPPHVTSTFQIEIIGFRNRWAGLDAVVSDRLVLCSLAPPGAALQHLTMASRFAPRYPISRRAAIEVRRAASLAEPGRASRSSTRKVTSSPWTKVRCRSVLT